MSVTTKEPSNVGFFEIFTNKPPLDPEEPGPESEGSPSDELDSFIKNFDKMLTLQYDLSEKVLGKTKIQNLQPFFLLYKESQQNVIYLLDQLISEFTSEQKVFCAYYVGARSLNREMNMTQQLVREKPLDDKGEQLFSEKQELEVVEEVTDSVKGKVGGFIKWVGDHWPLRKNEYETKWSERHGQKIQTGIKVTDEIVNVFRRLG